MRSGSSSRNAGAAMSDALLPLALCAEQRFRFGWSRDGGGAAEVTANVQRGFATDERLAFGERRVRRLFGADARLDAIRCVAFGDFARQVVVAAGAGLAHQHQLERGFADEVERVEAAAEGAWQSLDRFGVAAQG